MTSEGASRDRLVLVVRPEPGAGETVAALAAEGIPALACPPSRIVPVLPRPTVPEAAEGVILTSANAARAMGDALAGRPAWCVGRQTAAAARAAGCAPVHTAEGDGQALIARLAEEQPRHLFHPRGEDIAVDLRPPLAALGHRVSDAVVYRAEAVTRIEPAALQALDAGRVAVAGFWSARGARLALEAMRRAGAAAMAGLAAARLVALSPAVAEALALTGRKVTTAARPDGRVMQDLIVSEWS